MLKNTGKKEVRRHKNDTWQVSPLIEPRFLLPKNDKRKDRTTSHVHELCDSKLCSKDYLDINIYTYIIPSHTEHNSTTTTTTTTTHAHPYLYIYTYILYYINVYITFMSTKETPHSLLYDYYTGVHAIGICETPVCVSRIIICFSLFASNTLMITPLLVVSRIYIIVLVNSFHLSQ